MKNCGWDTETYLIGAPDSLIPKIVCGSWDMAEPGAHQSEYSSVFSTGDGNRLLDVTLRMWQAAYEQSMRIIIQNAAFDVAVALRFSWDVQAGLAPGDPHQARELNQLIWDTLEKSMDNEWTGSGPVLVSDTIIREKLLNLSSHGSLVVDKYGRDLRYSLDVLARRHLGIDISAGKVQAGKDGRIYDAKGNDITGTPAAGAAWRLRYAELDGVPTEQWPNEAQHYAWEDSVYARMIWDQQEGRIDHNHNATHNTVNSESLQVYSAVALQICTATGFRVDHHQVSRVKERVVEEISKIEEPLRANGIVRSNGSVNMKVVKARVEELWKNLGKAPLVTPTGDIATGKEIMETLCEFDPSLEIFARRQKLAKLRDAFLPSLVGDRVYTNFDVLKETGRTSSYGAREKKGRQPLFEAVNSQQMPRQIGMRECFLPPQPGQLICSDDYEALELCSTAQATYTLFGTSVHRDKINAGYDLHSYLGAAIAMLKEPEITGHSADLDDGYHFFVEHRKYRAPPGYFDRGVKDSEVEDRLHLATRAKHFRNFAKPVGLGYPGGLGEKTMVVFAKTVYHVMMEEHEARELKELWFHIYPEMQMYFDWVRHSQDNKNNDEEGKPRYCYRTPGFNRFRAGATYCATANGRSMQSLSADGAKRSVCWIVRACSGGLAEDNLFRILDRCNYLSFIHDENLVAIPDDALATERAMALSQLMILAMQQHMPDVRINAEPALMRRWRKNAEPEWVDRDNQRQQAWDLAWTQYGALGEDMMVQFSPQRTERLVPHEDIHGEAIADVA